MAANINAEALKESPIPEAIEPKASKQTIDPYNVWFPTSQGLALRVNSR